MREKGLICFLLELAVLFLEFSASACFCSCRWFAVVLGCVVFFIAGRMTAVSLFIRYWLLCVDGHLTVFIWVSVVVVSYCLQGVGCRVFLQLITFSIICAQL
jgi:hypothetical protein